MDRNMKVVKKDYLHRWYLIPKNKYFNIYLHKFIGSDTDRDLHDHPWCSLSVLLKGKLVEHYWTLKEYCSQIEVPRTKSRGILKFLPIYRSAWHSHKIELISKEAWTLFITGPHERDWGFYTKEGWVDSETYMRIQDDK